MFLPKYDVIHRRVSSHVKMLDPSTLAGPRHRVDRSPKCMIADQGCSLMTRKLVKQALTGNDGAAISPPAAVRRRQLTDGRHSHTEDSKTRLDSQLNSVRGSTPPSDEGLYKVLPDHVRYHYQQKIGHNVPIFEKQSAKKALVFTSLYPTDGTAFECPAPNFEARSNFRNTKNGPQLVNYAKRKELFKPLDLPDINYYNHVFKQPFEHTKQYDLGALPFEKRDSARPGPKKVEVEYDHAKVTAGLEELASAKRVKCYVALDKQRERDGLMYGFDPNDIKSLTRRLNKKELKFSDGLPNNMRPRRPGSRVDMSSSQVPNDFEALGPALDASMRSMNDYGSQTVAEYPYLKGNATQRSGTQAAPASELTTGHALGHIKQKSTVFNYQRGIFQLQPSIQFSDDAQSNFISRQRLINTSNAVIQHPEPHELSPKMAS